MKKLLTLLSMSLLVFTLAACTTPPPTNGDNGDNGDADTVTITTASDPTGLTITVSPESTVALDTEVTVQAPELAGHAFLHWLDADDTIISTDNPYTFIATEDLSLTAVYEATDTPEQAAINVMNLFSADLTHMEALLEEMAASETQTLNMRLDVTESDYDNPELSHDYHIDITQRILTVGTTITTETLIDLNTPDETIAFHFIVHETENFIELYFDASRLLDEIENEVAELEVRNAFAIENDILYLAIAKDLIDELDTELENLFGLLIEEMASEMVGEIDLDAFDLNQFLTDLERFEKYFTLDYLNAHEHMVVTAAIVDDTKISTDIQLTGDMLVALLEDLLEDIHGLMAPFDETGELPPLETIREMPEYIEAMNMIAEIDPLVITTIYEPYYNDKMTMVVDILGFLSQFEDEHVTFDPVQNMVLSITMETTATILVPDDAKDIYEIAEEVIKIALVLHAHDLTRNLMEWRTDIAAGSYTIDQLIAEGVYYDMPFINTALSTVEIIENGEREVWVDLYYLHNDQPVYKAPIEHETLEYYIYMDGPIVRTDVLEIIERIDDENFNVYLAVMDLLDRFLDMFAQAE